MTDQPQSRAIPVDVRRYLRSEVGFGCPVDGCGNPYLTYHHFDPPWHVEHHHDPDRMIALCLEHHSKERAWDKNEFRAMKRAPYRRGRVEGRFEWMKEDIAFIIGGNLYYRCPIAISSNQGNLIWCNRDSENRLLLNVRMLSLNSYAGTVFLDDNDWTILGPPADVESPPNGSFLRVRFPTGDDLSIKFRTNQTADDLKRDYGLNGLDGIDFPVVTAEINLIVGGTSLMFNAKKTTFGGHSMTGCALINCSTGVYLGTLPPGVTIGSEEYFMPEGAIKSGRNDLCLCGSGSKSKFCHG